METGIEFDHEESDAFSFPKTCCIRLQVCQIGIFKVFVANNDHSYDTGN